MPSELDSLLSDVPDRKPEALDSLLGDVPDRRSSPMIEFAPGVSVPPMKAPLPPALRPDAPTGTPAPVSPFSLPGATPEASIRAGQRLFDVTPPGGVADISKGVGGMLSKPSLPQAAGHASQIIRGAGKVLSPLAPMAIMQTPLATAAEFALGAAAQMGTEAGLEKMKVRPEYAQLAGDIVGALPFLNAARRMANIKPRATAAMKAPEPPNRGLEDVDLPPPKGATESPVALPATAQPVPKTTAPVALPETAQPVPKVTPEVVATKPQKRSTPKGVAGGVQDRILSTMDTLSEPGNYVPIGKLRESLPDVRPEMLDQFLIEMAKADKLVLGSYDGPRVGPEFQRHAPDLLLQGDPAKPESNTYIAVAKPRTSLTVGTPKTGERGSFSLRDKPPTGEARSREENYMNFDRMAISEPEKLRLRDEVNRAVDEQGLDPKEVEPHAAIVEAAKSVDPELAARVADQTKLGLQLRGVRFAIRQRINSLNKEVSVLEAKAIDPTLSGEERGALDVEIFSKTRDLRNLIGEWTGIRSEDGRNLASHLLMSDSTWDLPTWVSRAKRAMGRPSSAELPDATFKRIREIVSKGDRARQAGDMDGVSAARRDLSKTVADLQKSGLLETLTALRKAGLLTGLKTHGRNIGGNLAFQLAEEAMRVPASLIDMAVSLSTKRRTVAGSNPASFTRASMDAATKGIKQAREILKTGATADDLLKADATRELNSASPLINKYVNTVFRWLAAEDRVFKVYAMRRSLDAQARLIALNESRAGKISRAEVAGRDAQLRKAPTESMAAQAVADAEFATFNNKSGMAAAAQAMKAAAPAGGRFAMEMIVPFIRTPANVFARMLDYTPVGAGYKGIKSIIQSAAAREIRPEFQKAFSEAIGRGMVGTAIMGLGYVMARDGNATGTSQDDQALRNTDEAAGRSPGSVKLLGRWFRVAPFSPLGNLFTLGASLWRESHRSLKDELQRAGKIAAIGTKTVLEQPMLAGVQQTMRALERPGSAAQSMVASQAGSFVPTVISDLAGVMDPVEREAGKDSGLLGAAGRGIMQRLPVIRGALPERQTVLGETIPAATNYAIDPTLSRPASEEGDKAKKEMVRLEVGISDRRPAKGESPDVTRLLEQVRGKLARRALGMVVGNASYNSLPDDVKRERLKKALQRAYSEVSKITRATGYQKATDSQKKEVLDRIIKRIPAPQVVAPTVP